MSQEGTFSKLEQLDSTYLKRILRTSHQQNFVKTGVLANVLG